jgi:hypothetical protein
MSKQWMNVVVLTLASWMGACAADMVDEPLDRTDEVTTVEADAEGEIASQTQAIIFGDAPGPAGCKADCMDVCNQDGKHLADCQKSCHKACHGTAVPPASGGGGRNPICVAGNKAWELICRSTPPLQAACFFQGGCSGCRKKMDRNC